MRFVLILCAFIFTVIGPVHAADQKAEGARGLEAASKKDFDTAFKILTPLAEKGDGLAQYYLATIYEGGFGYKPPKLGEAYVWLQRAAEGGLMQAQASLGDKFYDGHGVPQDYAAALKWYRLSADQGFPPPQNTLGEMYELGRGVDEDPAAALKYYLLAADSGLARAQVNVGRMYGMGSGTAKDYETAVKYFQMAANQRNAAGAIWLGSAYETGSGVHKDRVQAYMWNLLAEKFADLRDSPANFQSGIGVILENLRYNMNSDDVARAEALAKAWTPSKPVP